MTPGQKSVVIQILNLWLHHRNGVNGIIHPGRERLAKVGRVSVRTVAATLKMLRDASVLKVTARPYGEGQKPTEYTMNTISLLVLCGAELPKWIEGELTEMQNEKHPKENKKRTLRSRKLHTTGVQKLHTVLIDVSIDEPEVKHAGATGNE
jgi:hypothetical protein